MTDKGGQASRHRLEEIQEPGQPNAAWDGSWTMSRSLVGKLVKF